ncbi:MAG: chloride channel protein, partial [Clostridia bacterium]|nr:chloride channel protein [Clostridia bacterium]
RFIGSSEALIEELVRGQGVWYLLLLYFGVRALLLILSNASGAPGGLFFPTLVLGALIGALCARLCIGFGLLGEEYYTVLLTVGMASFFSASARTPITALHFALEALGAEPNILAVTMGVAVSFLVIEIFGVPAFNETVLEARVEEENEGKSAQVIDTELTVRAGSFAVGKEIRDVLWPPTCVILSVDKSPTHHGGLTGISEGDVLHVHYRTYDPPVTMRRLEDLVGPQEGSARISMHERGSSEQIPDN